MATDLDYCAPTVRGNFAINDIKVRGLVPVASTSASTPSATTVTLGSGENPSEKGKALPLQNDPAPAHTTAFRVLDWFEPRSAVYELAGAFSHDTIDTIIGADIIWLADLAEPLANTLEFLFDRYHVSQLVLSHQTRSHQVDKLFFSKLEERGFRIRAKVLVSKQPELNIFVIYKTQSNTKKLEV